MKEEYDGASFPECESKHVIDPMVYIPINVGDWYVTRKYYKRVNAYWKFDAVPIFSWRLP